MKLWDKGVTIDQQIEQFTVGNDREIDMHIAIYDVQASLAHAEMLAYNWHYLFRRITTIRQRIKR